MNAPAAIHAIKVFFITNMPLLREMAVIPGFEIRWLPAFLNWLEARIAKKKPDTK